MKSDLSVTKKVHTLLLEILQTIEKQCWVLVSDNDLEDLVCKAITKAVVEVSDKDIEY